MTVTEPGIYPGIPEDVYHADTDLAPELGHSLSASGAKVLLKSPARYHYERQHGGKTSDAFDIGTAAHTLILGTGQPFVRIDVDDKRGAKWTEPAEAARAEGSIPLLRKDYDAVHRMAYAVATHPLAGKIFEQGDAEQSAYWVDQATGVTCRARVDWLRAGHIVDLKTTRNGHPADFERDAGNLGYHISAAHYTAGIEALTGLTMPFVIVAVEKEAPHFVSVHQFDDDYLAIGHARMREALELFAECKSSGVWPDYGNDIHVLSPPRWLARTKEF